MAVAHLRTHPMPQVRPLEYPLQQGMELLLGVLCRFWTWVPLMSSLRFIGPIRYFVTPFVDLNY